MSKSAGNRRRELIVDARTQKLMMVRWTVLPLAVMVIGAVGMLLVGHRMIQHLQELGGESPSFTMLLVSTLVYVVGVSAMVTWMALQQSHKIVGPALRLQKSIERMRQGDLDFAVTLRDGDELMAVAAELEAFRAELLQRAKTENEPAPAEESAEESADAPQGKPARTTL